MTYMFTFRYAFNLTKLYASFCHNNQTLELAYDTLQFNTKIIRIARQNFKILTLSVQSSLQTEGIG